MCSLVFVQLLIVVSFICVITVKFGSSHLSIIRLYCVGEGLRSEVQGGGECLILPQMPHAVGLDEVDKLRNSSFSAGRLA